MEAGALIMKPWLIIAIITAIIFAAFTITTLLKSRNWASTSAKIVDSSIEAIYHSPNSAITNHTDTHNFKLVINYQYQVNGKLYTGHNLYAGLPNIFSTELEAENVLRQFPRNAVVNVFYNPQNPEASALLLPTAKGGNKLLLILAGFVFVGFIGAAVIIVPKI